MNSTTARLTILILVFALCARTASAQETLRLKSLETLTENRPAAETSDMVPIHVSDRLLASPEGQEALRAFVTAKEAGLLTARKSAAANEVGDTKEFNVLTAIQSANPIWKTVGFTLRDTSHVANVWIDTNLDVTVSQTQLDELVEAILSRTPSESFRPEKGVIENDNYLFGDPPNYDGDEKVDILMFDIFEGTDDCCTLGFVHPLDISPNAPAGQGNQADVLYVDIKEGLQRGVHDLASTIAHEYQHLINFNYQDVGSTELTFVNEGQSEWASVVNGYFDRSIRYLSNISEHNTKLLEWRSSQGIAVVDNDYQRAGLFSTYIAERIGPEGTGSITRAKTSSGTFAVGRQGYEIVLAEHSLTLNEVVADFHMANFFNRKTPDAKYGYTAAARQSLQVVPTTSIDGTTRTVWDKADVLINGGAFHYVSWKDVSNFNLGVAIVSPPPPPDLTQEDKDRTVLRVLAEYTSGQLEVTDIVAGPDDHVLAGDFTRITLVISNTSVSNPRQLRLNIASSWSPQSGGVIRETLAYDNGTVTDEALFYVMDPPAIQATKFAVPANSTLLTVSAAPLYDNQFSNSDVPAGAPRDFRVHLWNDDGTGFPGEEVFHEDVMESPTISHLLNNGEFAFKDVDVTSHQITSSMLTDTVYVGISNAGTDNNYLVTALADYDGDNASYLYYQFSGTTSASWARFSSIAVGDDPIFADKVVPIRATFAISTAIESEAPSELPETITLHQNYPNPFNPSTSISYSLPRTMHVRLSVYDALGRRVATVMDGMQSAGVHQASIDAGAWTSGIYVYALETEDRTVTRKMVVLK